MITGATPAEAPLLPEGTRLLLIYDGWCGVCTRAVAWVQARDHSGRVAALPNQTPGLAERVGLRREQLDRAAWVIDRAGRRFAGAAAINRTLEELGCWRVLALPYGLPGIRHLEDEAYHWFAGNRGRFARWGIVPACARPGSDCLSADR